MPKYYPSIHLISTCYACKACISCVSNVQRRPLVRRSCFRLWGRHSTLACNGPPVTCFAPAHPHLRILSLSLYLKTWSEFRSLDFAFEGKSRGQNDSLRRAPKVQKWCATTLWYGQWHHANVSVTSRTTKHYSTPNSFEITIHFPTCFWRPAMISVHTVTDACALLAAAQPLRPCSVTCTVAPFSKALFSAASREKKLFLCTAFVWFNCCNCAVGNWYDTPWFTAFEASDAVALAFLTVTLSEKNWWRNSTMPRFYMLLAAIDMS